MDALVVVGAALAILLLGYLGFALLYPEKMQ